MTNEVPPARVAGHEDWDQARWIRILDRIEHRQPEVGLRFWGPPLWLEVTMNGPDSRRAAATTEDQPWDWQSNEPCDEVTQLAGAGADDFTLLAAAARYTVENLILNAVHEIGEWLWLDRQRPFPPHAMPPSGAGTGADQGNGAVVVAVAFGTNAEQSTTGGPVAADARLNARLVSRLCRLRAASRFAYPARTTVQFALPGPVVTSIPASAVSRWQATWSMATLVHCDADSAQLLALVARDVHKALVLNEVDQICRAFHVDGHRPWQLGASTGEAGAEPLDVLISYTPRAAGAASPRGAIGPATTHPPGQLRPLSSLIANRRERGPVV